MPRTLPEQRMNPLNRGQFESRRWMVSAVAFGIALVGLAPAALRAQVPGN